MPSWRIKAAVQGTLSRLPRRQRWNRLFQRYVTRSLALSDAQFLRKWHQCERHVRHLRERRQEPAPFTALELGTGWFPITPIGLALCGAERVYSIDTQDLLTQEQLVETLRYYARLHATGRIAFPHASSRDRLEEALARSDGAPVRHVLESLGVTHLIADARRSGLATGSIDLVCSNNTLEHIPRDTVAELFVEFRRLLAPGGLMSHHIDLADHYAGFDRSITVYNFLRFSSAAWKKYNNDLQYQSRLRISDYRRLLADSGWRLIDEDSKRKALADLRAIPLAPEFRGYSEADLAVYETWLQSIPAGPMA